MKRAVVFTSHARKKIALLREYDFRLTAKEVEEIVLNPTHVRPGYEGRKIAEGNISERHLLRVVYEELPHELRVITLYPAKRGRYED